MTKTGVRGHRVKHQRYQQEGPRKETGARGVELLLDAIDGHGGEPSEELAPLTVMVRRTT